MIKKEDCLNELLKNFPGFLKPLEEHRESWGESGSLYIELPIFVQYIRTLDESQLEKAFNLVEDLILSGDEYVQTAICSGLLEAVAGAFDRGQLDPKLVMPLVGIESRKYLEAWDKFCGVST